MSCLLLTALTGCGGDSPSASTTAPSVATTVLTTAAPSVSADDCYVTKAEVAEAIAKPVDDPRNGPTTMGRECLFVSGADKTAIDVGGRNIFDTWKAQADAEPVSGLGDEASYSASYERLVVRKGDKGLSVAGDNLGRPQLEKLARIIVDRL